MTPVALLPAIGAATASAAALFGDPVGYFNGPDFLSILANAISGILIALFSLFTGNVLGTTTV